MTERDRKDHPDSAQRTDEVSRQRGYGETHHAKQGATTNGPVDTAGFPQPPGAEDGADRGVLRDDGQPRPTADDSEPRLDEDGRPVFSPDDDRHPNAPDTLMSDMGAKSRASSDGPQETPVSREELEESYSSEDDS
jgi:hypothetical protein